MQYVFLDTNNLASGYILYGKFVFFRNNKRVEFYVIHNSKTVFFLEKSPVLKASWAVEDEPGLSLWQFQMPLSALPWMIDCIENGFWKKPSEGGFDSDVLHIKTIIEEQKLNIRFTPNCGSYEFPGFTIKNYSVPWGNDHVSQMQLPYILLREGGLLDGLKAISTKGIGK